MSCNESPDGNHCGHPTGTETSYGMGGGDIQYKCCYCGRLAAISYTIVEKQIEGHGKFATKRQRKIAKDWPEGWVPHWEAKNV